MGNAPLYLECDQPQRSIDAGFRRRQNRYRSIGGETHTSSKALAMTIGISKTRRRTAWALLCALVTVSFIVVLIPVWLIQPFRPQTHAALELSYWLRRVGPAISLACAVFIIGVSLWLWRSSSRWYKKGLLAVAIALSLLPLWFSRQNHFEWMFNPLSGSQYSRVSETDFVDATDMVLAVEENGESVAYPVRQMAYHHLVQDVVGGRPIVATY
jgi:hypothetical protein